MRNINEYLEDNLVYPINEGLFAFISKMLTKLLQKKTNMSENTSKEMEANLAKETESLNKEVQKVSKNKLKDIESWWKIYTKENKSAAEATSPMEYLQSILKNTANVTMTYKKMIEQYQGAGILNNTIICAFLGSSVRQYIIVIESIIKDNKKKLNVANQLTNLYKYLSGVKITDNEDGEKLFNDGVKELDGKGVEFLKKYKK
jgi:hypothetical protein